MGKFFSHFVVFLAVLICPSLSFAQAPDQLLKELVDKIKAAGNPSPIVEYVKWDEAYKNIPEDQKQAMNIKSPEEMKKIYEKMLRSPSEMMKQKMEPQIKEAPPERQQIMQQAVTRMQELMAQKEKEVRERIAATTYNVGSATISGNTATVKLSQIYQGETTEDDVKFIKSGDSWLLPTASIVTKPKPANPRLKPAEGVPAAPATKAPLSPAATPAAEPVPVQ